VGMQRVASLVPLLIRERRPSGGHSFRLTTGMATGLAFPNRECRPGWVML
jgi:hypothetical protein